VRNSTWSEFAVEIAFRGRNVVGWWSGGKKRIEVEGMWGMRLISLVQPPKLRVRFSLLLPLRTPLSPSSLFSFFARADTQTRSPQRFAIERERESESERERTDISSRRSGSLFLFINPLLHTVLSRCNSRAHSARKWGGKDKGRGGWSLTCTLCFRGLAEASAGWVDE